MKRLLWISIAILGFGLCGANADSILSPNNTELAVAVNDLRAEIEALSISTDRASAALASTDPQRPLEVFDQMLVELEEFGTSISDEGPLIWQIDEMIAGSSDLTLLLEERASTLERPEYSELAKISRNQFEELMEIRARLLELRADMNSTVVELQASKEIVEFSLMLNSYDTASRVIEQAVAAVTTLVLSAEFIFDAISQSTNGG